MQDILCKKKKKKKKNRLLFPILSLIDVRRFKGNFFFTNIFSN